MDSKQYLLQIERLDRLAQNKVDEIYRLETMATSISAQRTEGINVQTSKNNDRIGSIVTRIVEAQGDANKLTDSFYEYKCAARNHVEQINKEKYRRILYERYFNYKSLYQISAEEKENYRNVKRWHNQALEELQKILDVAL